MLGWALGFLLALPLLAAEYTAARQQRDLQVADVPVHA
jgi:hypothetical protein